ncbi:MAG: alginate lyase family protein [Lachnospiraceae bacterium]|nr:alginate lyase family protein [Lachnospiraceae bacterium]MCM1231987.1 alginate lyase family protein [Ruminococcus flavefaciens]
MKNNVKKRIVITTALIVVLLVVIILAVKAIGDKKEENGGKTFVHPGILNSAEELDLMKQYAAGENACEPWKTAYEELMTLVSSYYDPESSNYIDFDRLTTKVIVRSTSGGSNDMRVAASKTYNLAIAYHISGNAQYARTVKQILTQYAQQFQGVGSKTDGGGLYDCELPTGVIALKFCSAVEVLRYCGFEEWGESDTQALLDMFQRCEGEDTVCSMARLLDWTNDSDGLMSRYDMDNLAHGHAAFANYGALAYAVLAEDEDLYNRTIGNICGEVSPEYTSGSQSWERKAKVKGTGGAVAYNINPETGQNKEIDRDITHSTVMMSGLVTIAEIAFHQGDTDVFECHDRLLLRGIDYLARYNLGYDVEYTNVYPWSHHAYVLSTENRGGAILKDPMFEAAYNYYKYHSAADASEMAYLEELVNNPVLSPERISEDVSGMGTLLYSDADRKNLYAERGETKENPDYEILAQNYMAIIENAEASEDGKVAVSGAQQGVITYQTPDWSADGQVTTEMGIQLSSTTTGYIEFRLQSKDGTRYGQYADYEGEAGNTGSVLARIEVPDTNGEDLLLKSTVYKTDGSLGGMVITASNAQMLYVVIGLDEEDGEICYDRITIRPDNGYTSADPVSPTRPQPAGVEVVDDSGFTVQVQDGTADDAGTAYIIDMQNSIPVRLIELGMSDGDPVNGDWVLYGLKQEEITMDLENWDLLGRSEDFTADEWGISSLLLSGQEYRYIMLKGSASAVSSWSDRGEITVYTDESGLVTPSGMRRVSESEIQTIWYGWTGSSVDFMEYSLRGRTDNDLLTPMADSSNSSLYGRSDTYLIFQLPTATKVCAMKFATINEELLSGSWAVYGSGKLGTQEELWDVIAYSSEMEMQDGIVEIPINGDYRYIMIGGCGSGAFMSNWEQSWDYMTEIRFYEALSE